MGNTSIAWTDKTWNPVTGCSHVSDGCRNCYAEKISLRFKRSTKPWTDANAAENVVLHPERLGQLAKWRKPAMVFVNSMSDLFHPLVPDKFIEQVFQVMFWNPQHTYQVLTKRADRMREWVNEYFSVPMPNIWLGVSVENQRMADERIPLLLQTPAEVRFLSCEPLLGPIDLHMTVKFLGGSEAVKDWHPNWVIVGGESGPNFRLMDLAWARSIRDQCTMAGVAFFFKQISGLRPGMNSILDGKEWHEYPKSTEDR